MFDVTAGPGFFPDTAFVALQVAAALLRKRGSFKGDALNAPTLSSPRAVASGLSTPRCPRKPCDGGRETVDGAGAQAKDGVGPEARDQPLEDVAPVHKRGVAERRPR